MIILDNLDFFTFIIKVEFSSVELCYDKFRRILMRQTILLLEDDIAYSDTIKQFLVSKGYEVICAYDGQKAEELAYEKSIDLMLLDVKVPYQNGFRCLKSLRDEGCAVPAIFITSLHTTEDVTEGFEVGCDDYIRKPFVLKELLVRIESLLRRKYGTYTDKINIGDGFSFDVKHTLLEKDGESIALKNKELMLLTLFIENSNELLTYEKIFNTVWSYDKDASIASLRAYVKTLRATIGKEKIETIKNIGYRFVKK